MAGRLHTLVTPEGVPLDFDIPPLGERLAAFLLDGLIINALALVALVVTSSIHVAEGWAIYNVFNFVIRMFYFPWYEARWQGRTPGKRWQKLHVIDCGGRPLPVSAILARNFTREVEFNLPLQVLLVLPIVALEPNALWLWLAGLWLVGIMLVPVIQRDRRRVGDLIAGTLVVSKPETELLSDLAVEPVRLVRAVSMAEEPGAPAAGDAGEASAPEPESAPAPAPRPTGPQFTPDQLAIYGEYELEVLERLLRRPTGTESKAAFARVRERIEAKTGWAGDPVDDLVFLQAFYAAQRAALEQRLLMGRRRLDKHDGSNGTPPS